MNACQLVLSIILIAESAFAGALAQFMAQQVLVQGRLVGSLIGFLICLAHLISLCFYAVGLITLQQRHFLPYIVSRSTQSMLCTLLIYTWEMVDAVNHSGMQPACFATLCVGSVVVIVVVMGRKMLPEPPRRESSAMCAEMGQRMSVY